jgi:DNA polymerase-3 subunit gamma/tau
VQALAARDGAAVLAAVEGLRALGLSAAARWKRWRTLLQQHGRVQAVPGALDPEDPDTEDARAWPPRWPPTKPSCSTAWCCTAAASWA